MAPAAQVARPSESTTQIKTAKAGSKQAGFIPHSESSIAPRAPLKASGLLDSLYKFDEITPVMGRTYPELQLRDLVHHEKADELIRDLAITISRRGVVFFKNQDLSADEQKFLTNRLGHLTGKPASSGLHIHPVFNAERTSKDQVVDEKGTANKDNEISVISSELHRSLQVEPRSGADEWHSDCAFEPVPADYTSLKVHTQPHTGGDTMWASGYEVYDLMSPPLREMLEKLQGFYYPAEFVESAARFGYPLHPGPRGAADNVGTHLTTEHPMVRTNPVTGWKSIYGIGHHFNRIKGVSADESDMLKRYIRDMVTQNHATQLRYRWSKNDMAIWDNRSTYHAATPDYFDIGPRSGVRAVSCGERPYFDPNSGSRREELKGKLN